MGAGDAQKLVQGLERYEAGTFNDFYQLPLEHIVQPTQAERAGHLLPPPSRDQAAGAPASPHAAAAAAAQAAPGTRVLPQEAAAGRSTIFERLWICASWSGVPLSATLAVVARYLYGPVKPQSRRGRRIETLLQYLLCQGLTMCQATVPTFAVAFWIGGLARPLWSAGLSMLGGFLSAAAAQTAICILTCGDCFDCSARVLLPNRSHKAIGDISEGDLILSFNKGVFRVKKVLSKISSHELRPMCRIIFRLPNGDDGNIETTAGHPLWVAGKGWCTSPDLAVIEKPPWQPGREVQVGDIFVHFTGAAARVVSIEPYSSSQPPSNLVVDGPGTFFVQGILVHTSMKDISLTASGQGGYRTGALS